MGLRDALAAAVYGQLHGCTPRDMQLCNSAGGHATACATADATDQLHHRGASATAGATAAQQPHGVPVAPHATSAAIDATGILRLRQAKPELLTSPPRPYALTHAEADRAHAEPWDDPAIGRFVARLAVLMRRGLTATDADDLAERLHLRDVEEDDRRLCLECDHLAGAPRAWRCRQAAQAGVPTDRPADGIDLPRRCPAFEDCR